MAMTIVDLQARVESKMHSKTIDKLNDFYGLVYEAGGNVLLRIDPQETVRTTQITNALYDSVYDYVSPTDLKSDGVIDIRPQIIRVTGDNFNQVYGEEFDIYKTNQTFTTRFNSGVKTIRISKGLTAGSLAHNCNSLTENGTWAAGGNATNLSIDTLNFITGSGSLIFNVSASGSSAYVENSTLTAVDWSSLEDAGAVFVFVYIPSTTVITSVNLRWGSSSSNYNHRTVTTTQDNTSFVTGWNLLRFDWSGSTEVGTTVASAIGYLRVTFNYDGTVLTGCRVDNIIGRLGSIYEIEYYSNYLFRTSAGVWIEKPTTTTDLINLAAETYNLLVYECALLVSQEMQGEDSSVDVDFWTRKKKEVWDSYLMQNKSQRQKKISSYYRMRRTNRR